MDTFFDIEPQKRFRLTKLGAQKQHRVIQQFVPPSASKQSEITCAREKCVVFHNIGQAISGSKPLHGMCCVVPVFVSSAGKRMQSNSSQAAEDLGQYPFCFFSVFVLT